MLTLTEHGGGVEGVWAQSSRTKRSILPSLSTIYPPSRSGLWPMPNATSFFTLGATVWFDLVRRILRMKCAGLVERAVVVTPRFKLTARLSWVAWIT